MATLAVFLSVNFLRREGLITPAFGKATAKPKAQVATATRSANRTISLGN